MDDKPTCWIFGDESGQIGKDRFFSVGVIGTREPRAVIEILKDIRNRTDYEGEVSYKSNNKRRVLCAIRWMDWFFSNQDIAHFKMVLKDKNEFDVSYFDGNKYKAGAMQLAYCETYREVLNNFAGYQDDVKGLVYSKIGLQKMKLEEHLIGKVPGLMKKNFISRLSKERTKDDSEYTGAAEILQLCDLLTSSTRGLCCSVHGEETSDTWDKNTLRKNVHYFIPSIKERMVANKNVYHPNFEPYSDQKFVVYKWTGGDKRQNAPIE